MWKDFFYFSKGQQKGIILLIILILSAIIINLLLPTIFPPSANEKTDFLTEVERFKKSLVSRDSLKRIENEKKQAEWNKQYNAKIEQKSYTLFKFNPNTADSATFVKLGLSHKTASNIIKYRQKGGYFKVSEDFKKIYGITNEKYNELRPYIVIERKQTIQETKVDINSADTTELMRVSGIGSYYAKEIVNYRKRLGGFTSVEQLSEIRSMRSENYEKMLPQCIVDTSKVEKINVNTATMTRLKAHPYISPAQAKAIIELRKVKNKLNSYDELNKLYEFSFTDTERVKPYLSFK